MGKRDELWTGQGAIPMWRIRELQTQLDMGYWSAKFGLYGPKDVIQAHYDELKRIVAEKAPRGRLRGEMFAGENGQLLDATAVPEPHGCFFVGIPSLWSLPMVRYRLPKDGTGIGAHTDYSAIIPSSGKTLLDWVQTAKKVCEAEAFDLLCDFFMHERHVIFVNMMAFDKSDARQREAVNRIFHGLFREGKKRGFSNYRAHIDHMGLLYNHTV